MLTAGFYAYFTHARATGRLADRPAEAQAHSTQCPSMPPTSFRLCVCVFIFFRTATLQRADRINEAMSSSQPDPTTTIWRVGRLGKQTNKQTNAAKFYFANRAQRRQYHYPRSELDRLTPGSGGRPQLVIATVDNSLGSVYKTFVLRIK